MRLAALDCGTNTVLFLVADVSAGKHGRGKAVAVEQDIDITRLGQGLDQSGELRPEAMERTLAALVRFSARARALGAERVIAIGTESLRAARNGQEFLDRARHSGVPLGVVSGDDEARLSFRAVAATLPPGAGKRSVLDIGGGSTELIVGEDRPERFRSVPIGSVRLTERLLHHDPPTAEERAALCETIKRALVDLPAPEGELVGLAGTVTSVAAIHLGLEPYDGERVEGLRLPVADLSRMCERLGRMPLLERQKLRGLDPRRADVIYAGAMILLQVALLTGRSEIVVSDRGVRWGALEELADVMLPLFA